MMLQNMEPRGTCLAVESSGLANTHFKCVLDSIIATNDMAIKHGQTMEEYSG